jgi:hypothetical protein
MKLECNIFVAGRVRGNNDTPDSRMKVSLDAMSKDAAVHFNRQATARVEHVSFSLFALKKQRVSTQIEPQIRQFFASHTPSASCSTYCLSRMHLALA